MAWYYIPIFLISFLIGILIERKYWRNRFKVLGEVRYVQKKDGGMVFKVLFNEDLSDLPKRNGEYVLMKITTESQQPFGDLGDPSANAMNDNWGKDILEVD